MFNDRDVPDQTTARAAALSLMLHGALLLGVGAWMNAPSGKTLPKSDIEVVFWSPSPATAASGTSEDAPVPPNAATDGAPETVPSPSTEPEPPALADTPAERAPDTAVSDAEDPPTRVSEADNATPVPPIPIVDPTDTAPKDEITPKEEVAALPEPEPAPPPPPPKPRPVVKQQTRAPAPQKPAKQHVSQAAQRPPEPTREREDAVQPASDGARTAPDAKTSPHPAPSGDTSVAAASTSVAAALPPPIPVVNNPRFRHKPTPPTYPPTARSANQQGTVLVRALIDVEGHSREIIIWKTSGFDLLDRAALRAVGDWAFEPARVDGRAIEAWVEVPIRFALR